MNIIRVTSGGPFRLLLGIALAYLVHFSAGQNAGGMDIMVANNADSGNGTLRQAIQFNESLGGGNTIVFSNTVTGTISLTNVLGELLITRDVSVRGPGAKVLTINGNSSHRVFHLTNSANVNISGLTVSGGALQGFFEDGAGILQDSGALTLSNCLITGNFTIEGSGGGVRANGLLTVFNCGFFSNQGSGFPGGGAIYTAGLLAAMNSTFSGNGSAYLGGAVYQAGGTLALTNCTISGNYSITEYGGGVSVAGGTAVIRNSIIAANTAYAGSPDCNGAFTSAGFNLIGAMNGSSGWGALGDQVGTTNNPIDPGLGPVQDNDGPTPTMAPQIGSPVVDQGNSSGFSVDQRGRPRPHPIGYISSIPLGGDRADIGAYEVSPATLVVSNLNDSGPGSLRQAVASAGSVDGDNITFARGVAGTIVLTGGELSFGKDVNILGPGARALAISGNNSNRILHLTGGHTLLADVTVTQGTNNTTPFNPYGGGVFNEAAAQLIISNCAVIGNSAMHYGGGVANLGVLTVLNSTLAGNTVFGAGTSSALGGGLYSASYATLQNCTVSSNTAAGGFFSGGGGICNAGTNFLALEVYLSTIVSNTVLFSGTRPGGGIYNAGSSNSVVIDGSLIANNSTAGGPAQDVGGPFLSDTHNLIGVVDGSTGFTNGVNYDQVGSGAAPLDPQVGPLRDNGGPAPTHALLPGSPALDTGWASYGIFTDQRGAPRPFDFPAVPDGSLSYGWDVGAFELGRPGLSIQGSGNSVVVSWPSYYGDYALESATNLPPSNTWSAVPGTPTLVGEQFNVTDGTAGGKKFYQLKSK